MTPALDLLKKVRAEHRIHSYEHDPKAASYGLEAAAKRVSCWWRWCPWPEAWI
jgi:prolyl-tRNA editing enzyme YbaK/EbsC (Cys-tRNA(Pro) deacylase)